MNYKNNKNNYNQNNNKNIELILDKFKARKEELLLIKINIYKKHKINQIKIC